MSRRFSTYVVDPREEELWSNIFAGTWFEPTPVIPGGTYPSFKTGKYGEVEHSFEEEGEYSDTEEDLGDVEDLENLEDMEENLEEDLEENEYDEYDDSLQ